MSGINIIVRKFPGVINMPLQIRRGTEAERQAMTVALAAGELLYVTDDQRLYVGNGATVGGVQITGYTDEDARDAAAELFVSGTHTGVTFTYNDALNKIDAAINLSTYNGDITGDLSGSVFADDSTRLIDGTNGKINLNGTINGNIVPDQDSLYNLGSNTFKFKDLFLSGSSIHLGDAIITASGTAIDIPLGSTMGGVPLSGNGADYSGNIIGDDSTIIVNTATKVVTASGGFTGNLTGNVLGNVTGNLLGDVTGNILGGVTGNVLGNVTGNLTGNSTGYHFGDVTGSIFSENSSMLVDATNGSFRTNLLTIENNGITSSSTLELSFNTSAVFRGRSLRVVNNNATPDANSASSIIFESSRGTTEAPTTVLSGDKVATYAGSAWTGSSYQTLGGISIGASIGTTGSEPLPGTITMFVRGESGGYNSFAQLDGNGLFTSLALQTYGLTTTEKTTIINKYGGVGVGEDFIRGIIVYDTTLNNLTTFHPTNGWGTIQTSNAPHQLPVYADDAARSAAIPTPATGMMVFMSSGTAPAVTNKAVIYDSTAWVALH